MTITYHPGQIEVQTEANTRRVADMLADWVGPVGEFARVADMIVLARRHDDGPLRFTVVSGQPPLVNFAGGPKLMIPLGADGMLPSGPTPVGALAVNLAQRRRARLNGTLTREACGDYALVADEAFTNCRKYIAPSMALETALHVGPELREPIELSDQALQETIAGAETCFLASVSPDGQPDASHRGGPAGFLSLNVSERTLTWPEFVGDGMLKSAGNVRATGLATLLVVDLQTGDGFELMGVARYETLRRSKQPREDGLERHKEPFPVQGRMALAVERAYRVSRVITPRQRLEKAEKVTSSSPLAAQAPQ